MKKATRHASVFLLFLGMLGSTFLSFTTPNANAQDVDRRQLEHKDYDIWNTISGAGISNDGHWIQYTVQDGKSRATLKIRHAEKATEYSIPFGSGVRLSDDSRYAVYRVSPDPEQVKKLRKEKKEASIPKPHLEILELATGRMNRIDDVRSFQLPRENSEWIAILLNEKQDTKKENESSNVQDVFTVTEKGLKRETPNSHSGKGKSGGKKPSAKATKSAAELKKAASETKKAASKSKDKNESAKDTKKSLKPKTKGAGYTLILRNLSSGLERRFPNVTSYQFSKKGSLLAFATSVESGPKVKSDAIGDGVHVVQLKDGSHQQIISGNGNYRNLTIDEAGQQVAFLTDRNDDAKKPSWSLYHWKLKSREASKIAHEGDKGIPEGWWVAGNAGLQFHENGKRLYYSTAPKPEKEAEEDGEPKAKLDLWHWQDPQLQPQQLLQAAMDRNRSYRAVYDVRTKKRVQLADEAIPNVIIDPKLNSDWIVANTNQRYRKMMSWDTPGFQDIYLINQKTGEKKRILEKTRARGAISPNGVYALMWDYESRNYLALNLKKNGKPVNISQGIEVPLWDELNDRPMDPRSYGVAGWLEEDAAVLVYDRYDIWKLDPAGDAAPVCLTQSLGRENLQRLRYLSLDREARHISVDSPMYLSVFDEKTKGSGFSKLHPEKKELESLILLDEQLGRLAKSKHADQVMFTRSTFRMSPDIWTTDLEMKRLRRISKINPQQRDYLWGTAELTRWTSKKGEELEGILYKPDDFDPNRKYPLMVYFYERNSDNLHRYHAPAAGRSIINFSFYVSRGYVVFIPDIPYEVGFPGDSAFDSVIPGVEHVVSEGYIDEARIGMQGHSWGGYQTAYLVTKTDMFACAESGAPVSNMTSAYGGIRWGSGMSRMFQYEKTQSRIGATLWEDREKYILNSPVFQADKINTPLLILHNDQDGAVPWYQGIELFVALRRLERPCWLMNYNGEPHWVMKPENRIDFAKRMQQFFDHYLLEAPMPEWMATGIPAVDKGKEFGFEPAEVKESEGGASGSGE